MGFCEKSCGSVGCGVVVLTDLAMVVANLGHGARVS